MRAFVVLALCLVGIGFGIAAAATPNLGNAVMYGCAAVGFFGGGIVVGRKLPVT